LLNRNGLKPEGAVTGPDDRGCGGLLCRRDLLWMKWNSGNVPKKGNHSQLLKAVDYQLKFGWAINRTLPTNYEVYRQVVYPQRTPLQLTLGVNDNSVES